MNQKLKLILKIFSTLSVVIMIILAILLHGLKLIGLKPYSVLSGSMESVYPTGSLLYIKNVKPETLKVGDVITYKMVSGSICTHRIIELVADENNPDIVRFRTKGDENDSADGFYCFAIVLFDSRQNIKANPLQK